MQDILFNPNHRQLNSIHHKSSQYKMTYSYIKGDRWCLGRLRTELGMEKQWIFFKEHILVWRCPTILLRYQQWGMPSPKQEQSNQGRGQVQWAVRFPMAPEQCYCTWTDCLSRFVLGHVLPEAHTSLVPLEYSRTVALYHGWAVKHAED